MAFRNPIIGGNDTLVRQAMQSEGFVAGSSGWRITRDGDAEFNDVTVRGEFETGTGGDGIEIVGSPIPSIDFDTSNADEVSGAKIGYVALGGNNFALQGPDFGQGADYIHFEADPDTNHQFLTLRGVDGLQLITENTEAQVFLQGDAIGLFAPGGILISQSDISLEEAGTRIKRGSIVAPTLQNSWVNFGSGVAEAGYCEMPDGTGMLTGVIKDGVTTFGTVLFTLPAALRPDADHVFPSIGNGARVAQLVVQDDGDVVLQSASAGLTWLTLGACRWPIAGF